MKKDIVARWISVSEKLPPHEKGKCSKVVLVYTSRGQLSTDQYYAFNRGFWLSYHDNGPSELVTHWMPLPPLPRGDI